VRQRAQALVAAAPADGGLEQLPGALEGMLDRSDGDDAARLPSDRLEGQQAVGGELA